MKQQKNSIAFLITNLLMLSSSLLHAAEPKFSIVPTSGLTSLLIPSNFTETVTYQVTNNTKITRTLTMVPITGINQTLTGAGLCGNPFTLGPQQSCTLSLVIQGSQIPSSGVKGGPVICKTKNSGDTSPDPLLCSQPAQPNILDISTTTAGQHAYIANQLGNSVSVCQVNPATGFLSQCAVNATGLTGVEAIGFNPAGTLLYTANLSASTISVCNVNPSTGALSNCVNAGGSGFNQPDGVAFSPDGSIFYASNVGGFVSACLVNATTGQLSNCVNNSSLTFDGPSDLALNSAGTLAYVSNRFGSSVSVCNVSGQTVNSCNNLSGSQIDGPEGITLSPQGLHAYVANANSANVTVCNVLQDGTGLLANCAVTNGPFRGTGNVGLNNLGTFAYVPNQLLNQVFTCQVTLADGTLSTCLPSGGTGFNGPAGVVIH
ncbi:MAG: lactonase family protein [Gammaproteobacteria bacterium]